MTGRRTAVITGAAGGIGSALCAAFRNAGYLVIGIDRVRVAEPCDIVIEADIAALCSPTDTRSALAATLINAVANHSLAVLVNNAAVQILGGAEDVTVEDWVSTFRTNAHAPFALTQLLLPALEAGRGSVVNISSIHAIATKPGFIAYAASKAALVGLTRALAVDLSGRVRVNAILPAAIDTPMLRAGFQGESQTLGELERAHPLGRIGTPTEVANTAVFLASDQAGFANGAIWCLDGGIGCRLNDPV